MKRLSYIEDARCLKVKVNLMPIGSEGDELNLTVMILHVL